MKMIKLLFPIITSGFFATNAQAFLIKKTWENFTCEIREHSVLVKTSIETDNKLYAGELVSKHEKEITFSNLAFLKKLIKSAYIGGVEYDSQDRSTPYKILIEARTEDQGNKKDFVLYRFEGWDLEANKTQAGQALLSLVDNHCPKSAKEIGVLSKLPSYSVY